MCTVINHQSSTNVPRLVTYLQPRTGPPPLPPSLPTPRMSSSSHHHMHSLKCNDGQQYFVPPPCSLRPPTPPQPPRKKIELITTAGTVLAARQRPVGFAAGPAGFPIFTNGLFCWWEEVAIREKTARCIRLHRSLSLPAPEDITHSGRTKRSSASRKWSRAI